MENKIGQGGGESAAMAARRAQEAAARAAAEAARKQAEQQAAQAHKGRPAHGGHGQLEGERMALSEQTVVGPIAGGDSPDWPIESATLQGVLEAKPSLEDALKFDVVGKVLRDAYPNHPKEVHAVAAGWLATEYKMLKHEMPHKDPQVLRNELKETALDLGKRLDLEAAFAGAIDQGIHMVDGGLPEGTIVENFPDAIARAGGDRMDPKQAEEFERKKRAVAEGELDFSELYTSGKTATPEQLLAAKPSYKDVVKSPELQKALKQALEGDTDTRVAAHQLIKGWLLEQFKGVLAHEKHPDVMAHFDEFQTMAKSLGEALGLEQPVNMALWSALTSMDPSIKNPYIIER